MTAKTPTAAAIVMAAMLWAGAAEAAHLHVDPDAPLWMHVGAAALLVLHIGGGGVGIVSGAAALTARKGSRLHRAAGRIFLASMLVAYFIATCVSPFLSEGQRPNFIAGVMALYLLLSGWAATRPHSGAGAREFAGLAIALMVAAAGYLCMRMGAADPSGTVDGTPPQAFIMFVAAGAAAALGELHVIFRRTITGAARIARHLWRMCFSLFIASGSFFLGQQPIMPEWLRGSPILLVCALAPLAAMVFWLVRVRFSRQFMELEPRTEQTAG
jgi:hypothetical protein